MPVKYSKSTEKLGVSIGTVAIVPKPSSWTDSTNITTEGNAWNIISQYPGWLPCDGRTVNVSDYPSLYDVIGNTYGGTTGTTFVLPDYRSKKLMGTGYIDGNVGSGVSVTVSNGPGNIAADISQPGSQGGQYVIETVRQLPPGSEITPGTPASTPSIGGNANDTFSIGTYRTTGFSTIKTQIEGTITGNASWSAGPVSSRIIPAAPDHDHDVSFIRATGGLGPSADGSDPSCCGRSVGAYPNIDQGGSTNRFDRSSEPQRRHSHYISWGSGGTTSYGSYGHDNDAGSSGLSNDVFGSGVNQWSTNYSNSNNRGTTINKTVDVVNDLSMSVNPGNFVMRDQNIIKWDANLEVRLQSAEQLSLMTPYYRLKYMIKAY